MSSAFGPPRRAYAARRARAMVRAYTAMCPHIFLVRLYAPVRRATPRPHARRPSRDIPNVPPCGYWAFVLRDTCAYATRAAPLRVGPGVGL
jgi:hypothetical protein